MIDEATLHRIGAVSSQSGVPVSTLRVWENRYGAFSPHKTEGRHRLYGDEDVLRASLLRQLTEAGHAISTLARLSAAQLGALWHRQRQAQPGTHDPAQALRCVVVGLPLATRLQSAPVLAHLGRAHLQVLQVLPDLASAQALVLDTAPDLLVVAVSTLHRASQAALLRVRAQLGVAQVLVVYRFGQDPVIDALRAAGFQVRRAPLGDAELAEQIQALRWVDPMHSLGQTRPTGLIPPRKYDEATLTRVAGISSAVLCECPRHVAELIAQLASFEQYSQECLNNGTDDARLHAYLSAVSGSARALFEQALERVAAHEGIDLTPGASAQTPARAKPAANA